jgi:hypothetical protein
MDFVERFDSLEKGDVLGWRDYHADLMNRDTTHNSFLLRVSAKHGAVEEPDYFWVMLPTVVAATVTLIGVVVSM